ncbi:hypothetical protein [Streptomyces sp. HYC2]|uniref:hypothetical protein n=1 Tax=Streptomyces sp. HYC2 TaxID=2955207 RepID=UPI0024811D31|nr:hypothetical protein [Streptomyces sp. HYC2]
MADRAAVAALVRDHIERLTPTKQPAAHLPLVRKPITRYDAYDNRPKADQTAFRVTSTK